MSTPTGSSGGSWRIELSSTLKGIHVLRYFLFSGGLAVGIAVLQRAVVGPGLPGVGLLLGLGLGLLLFRGQLRSLAYPKLALSQENLFVFRRKETSEIPWTRIRSVEVEGANVTIALRSDAEQATSPAVRLTAAELGLSARELGERLRRLATEPSLRESLPDDRRARAMLASQ